MAHLNMDKVIKEPCLAFSLGAREDKLMLAGIKERDQERHGVTKHKDFGGLPDSSEVYNITVKHGL